ncbi:hypothetical protein STEG23_024393 [Scotinomys teguina]
MEPAMMRTQNDNTFVYEDVLMKSIALHVNLTFNKMQFLTYLRGMEARGVDEAQRGKSKNLERKSKLKRYNGFQVHLESVTKLNELEKQLASDSQPRARGHLPIVCHHSALPRDLQPVCASQSAASIIEALNPPPTPPLPPLRKEQTSQGHQPNMV